MGKLPARGAWMHAGRATRHIDTLDVTDTRYTVEESDRAARVARAMALAGRTFANEDKARRWLHRNLNALGGRTPMECIHTDAGARIVENLLARIHWGAPA